MREGDESPPFEVLRPKGPGRPSRIGDVDRRARTRLLTVIALIGVVVLMVAAVVLSGEVFQLAGFGIIAIGSAAYAALLERDSREQ